MGGGQASILIRLLKHIQKDKKIVAVTDTNDEKCKNIINGYKIESFPIVRKKEGIYFIMCHDYFNVGQYLQSEGFQVYTNHDIYYIVEELFKRQLYFQYEKLERCEKKYIDWNHDIEDLTGKINFLKTLLCDEISVQVLDARMQLLDTKDYVAFYLNCPVFGTHSESAYFEQELWEIYFDNDEVLVDCGAYTGDSATAFIKATAGRFKQIISFEPDRKNCMKYADNIQHERCVLYPYGVGAKSVRKAIIPNNSGTYFTTDMQADSVEVVALDEFLDEIPVTFIKMDIEGAELDALYGAEKLIRKYRPKLAISIYHRPEDIFEIPQWIQKLECDYRMRIRQHCYRNDKFDIRETILYAESRKRDEGN